MPDQRSSSHQVALSSLEAARAECILNAIRAIAPGGTCNLASVRELTRAEMSRPQFDQTIESLREAGRLDLMVVGYRVSARLAGDAE
jgi:DNA-binding transcriptional ArsR family regulator